MTVMSHDHAHDHDVDPESHYTQETWDARYAGSARVWSGNPNPRLVEQVAALTPGRALDVGCGEGADVVWLARQGWQAVGADVSEVALVRAAGHAEEAGVQDRVSWVHLDLVAGDALPGGQDLVSVQFFHPLAERFDEVYARIAAAVGPGGHLIVVAHHPQDRESGARRPHGPQLLFRPERLVEILDSTAWEVLVAEAQPREQQTQDGPVDVTDSVVLARRK